MIPVFDNDGNLPEGIHRISQPDLLNYFGSSSSRRKWLGERIKELLDLAKATGKIERIFIWGSFVTAKDSPNDLDVFIVVNDNFDEETLDNYDTLFNYAKAKMRFYADVFWTRISSGEDAISSLLMLIKTHATSNVVVLWR
jgi:predicted nucleotidyltransferase